MKLLKQFNEERASSAEIAKMHIRNAVRAVLVGEHARVALVHVTKHGYYSLPGGGIDLNRGESIKQALRRETKEETGCDIEIIKELGIVEEIRLQDNLLNRSFGFLAKVSGEKGTPLLQSDEKADRFELMWVPVSNAVRLISKFPHNMHLYHRYFLQRELVFLESATSRFPELFK